MIAFDSNILIYFLEANPEFGPKAEVVLREISKSGGVCSSLAITETMYGTIDSFEKITPLLSDKVQVCAVSQALAIVAGKLKIMYSLDNADAIHIATAILFKAEVFITNDHDVLKKKIPGIKIRGL